MQELDRAVDFYFQNGLAPSTRRTYNSAKKRYLSFCKDKDLLAIPASEQQLCRFVSYLANENLSHTSIKCYLAAIRHLHVAEAVDVPRKHCMARLEQVLRGVKSVQSKGPKRPQARLPITPELLRRLREVWLVGGGDLDGIMLWAAVTLCFFGFLRSGEITVSSDNAYDESSHLSFRDITVDNFQNPQMLKVRIKASKTDPFRVGTDIFVGKTGNNLCPVSAVLQYMVRRGSAAGPFFRFMDGHPLSRTRLVAKVRGALNKAGIDCSAYSGHSFRSGAATTAARQGIGDATIKMLGRWRSSAYQAYIKTLREQLAAYSRQLGQDT